MPRLRPGSGICTAGGWACIGSVVVVGAGRVVVVVDVGAAEVCGANVGSVPALAAPSLPRPNTYAYVPITSAQTATPTATTVKMRKRLCTTVRVSEDDRGTRLYRTDRAIL